VKVERILLTKRPLEVTALRREESYLTKENLEHLMKEHTRGCPICCLIAHDTFGSFIGMLLACSAGKTLRRAKGSELYFDGCRFSKLWGSRSLSSSVGRSVKFGRDGDEVSGSNGQVAG
jgi:hypothetical protein